MELQQDCSSPALKQLQTWVVELESLFCSVVLSSPGRLKEINNCKMDEGRVCSVERPADFYSNLLVRLHLLLSCSRLLFTIGRMQRHCACSRLLL